MRNWVGQSTSEDFYDLADRYGLLVWDEFFQPAAGLDSGRERGETGEQDLSDVSLYLANVREKVLRFRNHPSIALWCGRNEGAPSPKFMADRLVEIMAELDPRRAFQPDSDAGRGVRSGGPYWWQPPASYYAEGRGAPLTPFKTEIGSVSIPTLEAISAMMPAADAEHFPNDDWAEHDFATGGGNNHSAQYLATLASRYGDISTLPRFVRAAQMANYEAYRALYEGRFAKLFNPSNAVITWMSNPAQPSLTWQIYSYDLEPFASFFAVKKACESLHIQMNQSDFHVVVINHDATPRAGLTVRTRVIGLDGKTVADQTRDVGTAAASSATDLGALVVPVQLSGLHFVRLELHRRGRPHDLGQHLLASRDDARRSQGARRLAAGHARRGRRPPRRRRQSPARRHARQLHVSGRAPRARPAAQPADEPARAAGVLLGQLRVAPPG